MQYLGLTHGPDISSHGLAIHLFIRYSLIFAKLFFVLFFTMAYCVSGTTPDFMPSGSDHLTSSSFSPVKSLDFWNLFKPSSPPPPRHTHTPHSKGSSVVWRHLFFSCFSSKARNKYNIISQKEWKYNFSDQVHTGGRSKVCFSIFQFIFSFCHHPTKHRNNECNNSPLFRMPIRG